MRYIHAYRTVSWLRERDIYMRSARFISQAEQHKMLANRMLAKRLVGETTGHQLTISCRRQREYRRIVTKTKSESETSKSWLPF